MEEQKIIGQIQSQGTAKIVKRDVLELLLRLHGDIEQLVNPPSGSLHHQLEHQYLQYSTKSSPSRDKLQKSKQQSKEYQTLPMLERCRGQP